MAAPDVAGEALHASHVQLFGQRIERLGDDIADHTPTGQRWRISAGDITKRLTSLTAIGADAGRVTGVKPWLRSCWTTTL